MYVILLFSFWLFRIMYLLPLALFITELLTIFLTKSHFVDSSSDIYNFLCP